VELVAFDFDVANSIPRDAGSAPPSAVIVDCLHAKIINQEDGVEVGQDKKFVDGKTEQDHIAKSSGVTT
jgi:hypothetical protein